MKILMATMGLDIGGAETHIVELSKELKHRGHEIAVVSNGGVYVPEITAAGIRHYEAPLHRRTLSDMRRSLAVLREVIRTEKPDVVHAHARIPAFLCGRLQKSMGFPFVTSCHGVPGQRRPAPAVQLGGPDPGGLRGHPGLPDPAIQHSPPAHHPHHQRHRHRQILPGDLGRGGPPGVPTGGRPRGRARQPSGRGDRPDRPAAHRKRSSPGPCLPRHPYPHCGRRNGL